MIDDEKKIDLLRKVSLHLIRPDIFPATKLSLDDCADFLSLYTQKPATRSMAAKLECSGLMKMRKMFEQKGIKRIADISG